VVPLKMQQRHKLIDKNDLMASFLIESISLIFLKLKIAANPKD
jgi:hypothetical protein